MSKAERVERRRLLRRKHRGIERQDLYTLDYIRHKYPDIHGEAVRRYEYLNKKYPDKFDLRKTNEHKVWKMQNPAQLHSFFSIQEPFHIPVDAEITVTYNQDEQANTEQGEQANTEQIQHEDQSSCPELQSNPEPTSTPEQQPNPEPQPTPEQQPNPEPQPTPQPPSSPEPPTSPEPQRNPEQTVQCEPQRSNTKLPHDDNMQLIIPLLKPPAKHPSVTAETLQIITEEVLQEGNTLQPPLCEEIDPEVFQKIVNELRADPELQNIFNDIEQQIEFEELGMDLEIPEDSNILERELENWEFW